MKSILLLGNCVAGLYKFRKEVIEALIKDGYSVYFSTPNNDALFVEKLKSMGAEFIETPIDRRGLNPFKDIVLFLKYLMMIKKIKAVILPVSDKHCVKPDRVSLRLINAMQNAPKAPIPAASVGVKMPV